MTATPGALDPTTQPYLTTPPSSFSTRTTDGSSTGHQGNYSQQGFSMNNADADDGMPSNGVLPLQEQQQRRQALPPFGEQDPRCTS